MRLPHPCISPLVCCLSYLTELTVSQHPEIGQRAMRLSSVALLEGGDADALAEGEEVTLKNWGNVKIKKVDKDTTGESQDGSGFQRVVRDYAVRVALLAAVVGETLRFGWLFFRRLLING